MTWVIRTHFVFRVWYIYFRTIRSFLDRILFESWAYFWPVRPKWEVKHDMWALCFRFAKYKVHTQILKVPPVANYLLLSLLSLYFPISFIVLWFPREHIRYVMHKEISVYRCSVSGRLYAACCKKRCTWYLQDEKAVSGRGIWSHSTLYLELWA